MPRRQAVLEINVAAEVLFAIGAETVALWDNHGGGGNIESAELDARITMIKPKEYWQSFAEGAKGFLLKIHLIVYAFSDITPWKVPLAAYWHIL